MKINILKFMSKYTDLSSEFSSTFPSRLNDKNPLNVKKKVQFSPIIGVIYIDSYKKYNKIETKGRRKEVYGKYKKLESVGCKCDIF